MASAKRTSTTGKQIKSPADDAPTDDPVLVKALKRYDESYEYQRSNWHKRWDRANKLYDNERVDAAYKGTTDTFVPMTYQTIETMTSALNNANLRFDYESGDPMKRVDPAPLNALVEEYWDQGQWDLELEEDYRETFIDGMVAHMLAWDIDHPELESFAMRDAIVDPTIKKPADLQKAGSYAGRRYHVRKGTLETYEVVDTDLNSKTYGELIPRFNLESITNAPGGINNGQPDDKAVKEMFAGSTLGSAADDQDELIEIWDIDRVVTMRNRTDVIENIVNPYKERHQMLLEKRFQAEIDAKLESGGYVDVQGYPDMETYEKESDAVKSRATSEAKGLVPFFFLRNLRRKSLFYAKGEIESIAKEQELLNDFTNMEADYIIRQLAPQKELDPEYEDWIDLITNDPDIVYPFKPGSLKDRDTPVLPANSFNNRMNIKAEIRETTAIDQIAKGQQAKGDITATEVNAQLAGTGQRIESKARIFEKDGLYWWGYILFRLIQLNVDRPLVVETFDAKQDRAAMLEKYGIDLPPGAAIFDPADYQEDWKPRIVLDVEAKSKEREQMEQARESYQILIQDPTNNLEEAKKRLYPKMFNIDKGDLQAIMTAPAQPMLPNAAPAPAVVPPGVPDGQ
ncbi:hypothetical protein [Naasia lichenicola]|uniref:Uncharacterized protein n=1 Tax=Naasia lichenicola TaxID=2565933 RepID=A0A4S4FN93_9MICO|nr:hypothetical protein [Naasia lichenicola]THG30682.1 hypothetical protein E6C64_08560 [Naasia lichenicola]THG31919.1 hypothetical protein E6C64_07705 [Naasia lichenicola]